jgi:hypothetical protein
MGYRYGEHRYSEGLYSRWPDWWHAKDCVNDIWDETICEPLVVEIVEPVLSSWESVMCGPRIWAPDPDLIPHPEQWKPADQQAVIVEKQRLWQRIR